MSRHPEFLTVPPTGGPARPAAFLDASTSAAALAVAAEVATRVADPTRVARLVAAAAAQTTHPGSAHWRDHAVGQGHAGLALLFGALDHHQPGDGWDRTAHRHLELAARAAEAQPRPASGLFAGLAGIGLVATCLSGDGSRYRRLLATVDTALAATHRSPGGAGPGRAPEPAPRRAGPGGAPEPAPRRAGPGGAPHRDGGYAVRELDLISGLAGVGAYLLLRRGEPGPAAALRSVLGSLVEVAGIDPGGPRWRTPPALLSADERDRYPDGYLNCGLAHGIPGPLAVLALARQAGVDHPGLDAAVAHAAGWLANHRADDTSGPNWPNAIPLTGTAQPAGPARTAWCYGGPGVATALRLAAAALADRHHHEVATAALAAALTRPAIPPNPATPTVTTPTGWRTPASPTFCHGRAGLLAVTCSFARATGDPGLRQAVATMTAELLDQFDPSAPLGYRDLEAGGAAVDQPGLLTGAPGVALALLGATSPTEPAWTRLFLLA